MKTLKIKIPPTPQIVIRFVSIEIGRIKCMEENVLLKIMGIYMEKTIATHSSTLAWKIPWTEGPGRLQSMGSLRVGHD